MPRTLAFVFVFGRKGLWALTAPFLATVSRRARVLAFAPTDVCQHACCGSVEFLMTRREWIATLAAAAPLATATSAKTGSNSSGKIGLSRLSAISDEIATAPEGALAFARMYQ